MLALLRALLTLGVGLAAATLALSFYVEWRYDARIVRAEEAPEAPVALVFGAGLAQGAPSPVLAERLDAAYALWRAGKVERVLVSGDNAERYHDETLAMRRYLLRRGLPEDALQADLGGLSTYDSCVRARRHFGVQRALLVTQRFHLPRALFIANSVGLDAWGVPADAGRRGTRRYAVRELLSRPLALLMVLFEVEPVVRGRLPPGR